MQLNRMQRCFLWLACVADGSLRVRLPGQPGGERSQRHRCCLEPADWFCERLQHHGGAGFEKKVLRFFAGHAAVSHSSSIQSSGGVQVCALLEMSSRGCRYDSGLSTEWSQEAALQRTYYNNPADCYELV